MNVGETWVMRNEIWILFVVYSLNFPSRFYARAFVFRAWKGISLKARSKNRKGKEKKEKKFQGLQWKADFSCSLTANVSCLRSEHLDSILYLSSLPISFCCFLDLQKTLAMIVSPINKIVKNMPKRIGDGCDAFLMRSFGSLLGFPKWYSVMNVPWLLPFWFLANTKILKISFSVEFRNFPKTFRLVSSLKVGSKAFVWLNLEWKFTLKSIQLQMREKNSWHSCQVQIITNGMWNSRGQRWIRSWKISIFGLFT